MVVDKVNYIESLNFIIIDDHLRFSEVIEPIEKFSLKIEDRTNNFLRKLKDIDFFSKDILSKLYVSESGPGVLYGLPKIHKPDFKSNLQFRPILAAFKHS